MLNGARVLTLGAAFKPMVSDVRNSRAIHIMGLLQQAGARLSYSDPMVPSLDLDGQVLKSVDAEAIDPTSVDLVVVLVGRRWPMKRFVDAERLIFDASAATQGMNSPTLDRL
jgi:UDP-N-acetyl-D-glucosamine dehydrogenase